MNKVIDKYANTITLFVTVPPPPANPKLNPDGTLKQPLTTPQTTPTEGFQDNFVNNAVSETQRNDAMQERGMAAEGPDMGGIAEGPKAGGMAGGGVTAGSMAAVTDANAEGGDVSSLKVGGENGVAMESGAQSSESAPDSEKAPPVNMEDANRPLQRSVWDMWVLFVR